MDADKIDVGIGTLFIVATPIGNLGDITLRAIETLKSVDLIACEDTRHTKILISRYQINTPLTSYFEHNKITKGEYLIGLLKEGKNIALVSDAGTPGISDPGFNIIRSAIENNIPVSVLPGPSALITALVLSGKPTDRFFFGGFLSHKSAARRRQLAEIMNMKCTLIFYESPFRILKTLNDIYEIMGDRDIVVARELTKKFEEVKRGKASDIIKDFNRHTPKGEFIIII